MTGERRHVDAAGVDKPRDHVARAVELRHGLQLSAPQPPLHQGAVQLLGDPAPPAVDEVLDEIAVRETNAAEVAHGIVCVRRRVPGRGVGASELLPIVGPREALVAVLEQPVLLVEGRVEDAVGVQRRQAVAVVVVAVALGEEAVS
ncbi:MAG: hypothetical protein IPG04_09225 [Polyangiaceae bacterium]|nr:hypothetical protein [Polyangiaceae bacterium]